MKKERYDLVFGFGATCGCSLTLRRAGLQLLSFPGDWTAPVWHDETHPRLQHDLRQRVDYFCGDKEVFFRPEDFRFRAPHPWNGKDVYYNERTLYVFNHDFPQGGDFAAELPGVVAKYRRRYERLTELIRGSKRVLVVRMDIPSGDRPKATLDDCRYARGRLRETYPGVEFDFALVSYDPGRPYERLTEERTEDGIYHYGFDFANPKPGADPYQPDLGKTGRLFAERFEVREYRTKAEIAAHRLAVRRKKWAKVGATGPFGYFWKKLLAVLTGGKLSPKAKEK